MAFLSDDDRKLLGRLLDPGIDESELIRLVATKTSSPPREPGQIGLSKEQSRALEEEILSLQSAAYLEPDAVRFAIQQFSNDFTTHFLGQFASLNPALTMRQVGMFVSSEFGIDATRVFFLKNTSAIMGISQVNEWPTSSQKNLLFELVHDFSQSFSGCRGWAYSKAIVSTWPETSETLLQWMAAQIAPVVNAVECDNPSTSERKKERKALSDVTLRENFRPMTEDAKLYERAMWALDALHKDAPVRNFRAGYRVAEELLNSLADTGTPFLAILSQFLRDFRAMERIAGRSNTPNVLQSVLEDL